MFVVLTTLPNESPNFKGSLSHPVAPKVGLSQWHLLLWEVQVPWTSKLHLSPHTRSYYFERAPSLQMETSSEFENKLSNSDFSASLGSQPSGIDLNRGITSLLEKVFGSSRMAINSPGTMCKRRLVDFIKWIKSEWFLYVSVGRVNKNRDDMTRQKNEINSLCFWKSTWIVWSSLIPLISIHPSPEVPWLCHIFAQLGDEEQQTEDEPPPDELEVAVFTTWFPMWCGGSRIRTASLRCFMFGAFWGNTWRLFGVKGGQPMSYVALFRDGPCLQCA